MNMKTKEVALFLQLYIFTWNTWFEASVYCVWHHRVIHVMKNLDKTKKLCFDTRETSEDMGKELANPCRLYSYSISLVTFSDFN